MADIAFEDEVENTVRSSRPSLEQVRAIIGFIQKHPDLAHKKLQNGITRQKIKKLWVELSNLANALEGTFKTTKGWIKFWSDKRRSVFLKKKQIDEGKLQDSLAPTEQQIYDLCYPADQTVKDSNRRKKNVPLEISNEEEDSMDEIFPDRDLDLTAVANSRLIPSDTEERQLSIMEKLVDVMDQQTQAMAQMAQAAHNNSKALERIAEASHIQALAVDRVATTFEGITSSALDIRNSIISIDYTLKRCYPTSSTQQRQNSNLFG